MEERPYIYDKEAGLETIRDPMIALINGRYYLTGTQPPYWNGPNAGVHLWSSDDLKHWTDHGVVIKRDDMPENMWCRDRFWAPELFDAKNGYYYLTFNAQNDDPRYKHFLSSGIARAEKPEGPYTIMSRERPLPEETDGSNDADLFREGDNVYLFCNQKDGINIYRLNTDDFTLSDRKCIVQPGKGEEWDTIGVEGACCVKRCGLYFLWYSSWTHGYGAGIAVSDSLYGDWKKCDANPILSESEIWHCAGHNHCFRDKDGKDYLTFHASMNDPADGGKERFFIRPVEYYPDGTVKIF